MNNSRATCPPSILRLLIHQVKYPLRRDDRPLSTQKLIKETDNRLIETAQIIDKCVKDTKFDSRLQGLFAKITVAVTKLPIKPTAFREDMENTLNCFT